MKFLIDAQLSKSLAEMFQRNGFDALHTLGLPNKNQTTDKEIAEIADSENRVVVTKDSDFLQAHILTGRPKKLIVVSTGNIQNSKLLEIFKKTLSNLSEILSESDFVEIYENKIVSH